MNYSQTDIDNHIKDIIGADEPESVTNKMVGAVLDHLNNMLKKANESVRIISIKGVITPDDDNDNYKKCQDVNGIVYHESANKFADFYGISSDPFDYKSITDGSFPGATKNGTPLGSVLYFVAADQGCHNAGLYKYNGKRLVNLFYIDELNDKVLGIAKNVTDLINSKKVMTFDGITDVEPETGLPGLLQYPVGSILWIRPWRVFIEILPDNDWEHYNGHSHAEANRLYICNNTLYIGCENLAVDNVDLVPIDGNRSVCYCVARVPQVPTSAEGYKPGDRVIVPGSNFTVAVLGPGNVWTHDTWSCPDGHLRPDLIYAVEGEPDAPPMLFVALKKPDGNYVLNAVATENWISKNGYINYVEASDDIEAVETGEPGTLKLRLTERIKATALRKTEQALTTDERARVLANLGDPQLAELKAQAKLIGAGYSESTDRFSFNGLTDITADEMRLIILETGDGTALYKAKFAWSEIRTMRAAASIRQGIVDADQSYAFFRCQRLEVAVIGTEQARSFVPAGVAGMFSGCAKLREVRGLLCLIGGTGSGIFKGCAALEEIRCITRGNCDFSDCPRLSLASLRHMVDNHEPVVTSMVTITVHADVYAKLTGDDDSEAYTSLTTEEQEQWTALVALALEKNIAFATV